MNTMNQSRYFDFNGEFFHSEDAVFQVNNRSFRYGDGLFETMRWENGRLMLLNYHTERLHKGMDLLMLEGTKVFSSQFIQQKVAALLKKNQLLEDECRVRFTVFRDGAGLYTPQTNQSVYLIEAY